MTELIRRTYKVTELDDETLRRLAEESGTLSKSAELRMLIRQEAARRGLVVVELSHTGQEENEA